MAKAGESTPLVKESGGTPTDDGEQVSTSRDKTKLAQLIFFVFLAALLLLWGIGYLIHTGARSSASPIKVILPEEASDVVYRPICQVYGKKHSVSIVQTSFEEPSRQWTPVLCATGAPDDPRFSFKKQEVLLNAYGAPDAIAQVDFSESAHPSRSVPIMGFGGAFTEASALNYNSLSKEGQEAVMELLYGKSGLGYSLGRVHINSCDFSVKSYNFDDKDGDFELKHFDTSVKHDVKSGMVDMILTATSMVRDQWGKLADDDEGIMPDGILKMIASPWSPPPWMKAPTPDDAKDAVHAENMTNSAKPTCLRVGVGPDSPYAKTWALYFSKFITAYEDLGIPLFAVTVQNEPEFAAPWEACSFNKQTEGEFLFNHLGPTLREAHPDLKIFMFDHNKDHVVNWAKFLLDARHPASKYIDGTAIHWYAGGMDRLLDGGVGSPNFHRFISVLKKLHVKDDHIILGSEACHCPSTGYAGGDPKVAWARAERYAHTILADLAAGSNGWIEWNLVLDSIGGPNHIGNMCDAPILAVPHRAKGSGAVRGKKGFELPSFEHAGYKYGRVVGDGRTREELNALGFPAKFLDVGVVVQPLYYYMGHISRHVRPGSRAVKAIVDRSEGGPQEQTFRPNGQVVAGGGINNLARTGIELTVWPCEGSTRQQFRWNDEKQLEVAGHDWLDIPTTSCVGKKENKAFQGVTTTKCNVTLNRAGQFDLVPAASENQSLSVDFVNIVLKNGIASPSKSCLIIMPLKNSGGANGPRGGAQVTFGNCDSEAAKWIYTEETGEVSSAFFSDQDDGGEVCLTTGWPFLQVGAFDTPNGDSKQAVVILNEAGEPANYALKDGDDVILTASIPAHSIQTISLD